MHARSGRTVRDLRRENRTAVLRRLYFDGPMSRLTLGPATGLSSGSVSNVVAELVAEGLVEEAGSVDSAGGRPRTLVRITPGSGFMIGVDIGETRIRIELFDLALTELARTERPLASSGPRTARYDVDLVVAHLREGIAEVLRTAEVPADRLLGVGIGVPGIVARTPEDGAVVHGQTVGWNAVPLERLLREHVELPASVPYWIDNGAKTLGQAEMWFGAGRGARSAVVVLVRGCGGPARTLARGGRVPPGGRGRGDGPDGHARRRLPRRDRNRPRRHRPRRPGGDRRIPRRRLRRPDQPLPARTPEAEPTPPSPAWQTALRDRVSP